MKLLNHQLEIQRRGAPVPLECEQCGIVFYKPRTEVRLAIKGHPQFALRFCSRACHYARQKQINHIDLPCAQCGRIIRKQKSWIKNNRHNFCSKSCSARFQNAHKTLGKSRASKAETYLAKLIRADFEHLVVEENVRNVLPSGLELDLYIPALKLAIELNGPLHFFPIYGQAKLQAVQDKDAKKRIEARLVGCSLITIDISRIKYWRETQAFLDSEYKSRIKPIIETTWAGK